MKQDDKRRKQLKNTLELLRNSQEGGYPSRWPSGLFAPRRREFSGEISKGEDLEVTAILAGKQEEVENNKKLKRQLELERRAREEEKVLVEKRTNELKLRIKAIQEELVRVSKNTNTLSEQTGIAALLADTEPTVYNLFFLERIAELIRNFRKRVEDANIWLLEQNKRAVKKTKNRWGQNYKKHGAKYLLSGEHYLSRSAG